jgi:hypothetical protein
MWACVILCVPDRNQVLNFGEGVNKKRPIGRLRHMRENNI